jgi:hypothetical protein
MTAATKPELACGRAQQTHIIGPILKVLSLSKESSEYQVLKVAD